MDPNHCTGQTLLMCYKLGDQTLLASVPEPHPTVASARGEVGVSARLFNWKQLGYGIAKLLYLDEWTHDNNGFYLGVDL